MLSIGDGALVGKRTTLSIAIALSVTFFMSPTWAETVDYVFQGTPLFRFDVPEGWDYRSGYEVPAEEIPRGLSPAPRVISVRPPGEDQVMWSGLWSPPEVGSFEEARVYLGRLIPRQLANPKITYNNERTVNGRSTRVFSGNATRSGREFDFVFAVIQIAPRQVAIVAFIGESGIFDRHEAELRDMLNSVRPLRSVR